MLQRIAGLYVNSSSVFISSCTMLLYIFFWCITRGKKRKWGKMLFAAYFFDFIFQHFNDINMLVSGYKVKKQAIE